MNEVFAFVAGVTTGMGTLAAIAAACAAWLRRRHKRALPPLFGPTGHGSTGVDLSAYTAPREDLGRTPPQP